MSLLIVVKKLASRIMSCDRIVNFVTSSPFDNHVTFDVTKVPGYTSVSPKTKIGSNFAYVLHDGVIHLVDST